MTAPADNIARSATRSTVDRHDGARQHGRRRGDQHGRRHRDDDHAATTVGAGRRVPRHRPADRRHVRCSTSSPPARRARTGARRAHRRLRPRRPGTLLFEADDPDNDDNGPGNYAYPTDAATSTPAPTTSQHFAGLRRRATGSSFRVRTRDLTPTFGSPLGAQLVDVYVHVPGATPTSTAASFPQRNYAIAARGRVEPADRGPGLRPAVRRRRRRDARARSTSAANAISRYITFSVPKARLGDARPPAGASRSC